MFIKRDSDLDNYYVDWIMCVIFDIEQPLTLAEIREHIYHKFNKRWSKRIAKRYIKCAVENRLLSTRIEGERELYYPTLSYDEFQAYEVERMKEWMKNTDLSRYTTFHAMPEEITQEQYDRIKKLIDELEQ